MKRTMAAVAVAFLFSTSLFAADAQRYLVATKRPFAQGALAAVIRDMRDGVSPRDVAGFDTFTGFAATLTSSEVAALRKSGEVRWIEPVIERHAAAVTRNYDGQTVPYGIDVVHAREAWTAKRPGMVNVAVLDTGIDFRHPELADIYAGGINFYGTGAALPLDDAGHGTHVAGTIVAADNALGVVGVAQQANTKLWAVKVLNSSGAGTNETVVKGIDWVFNKKKEVGGNWVINMSLGSRTDSIAEAESVKRATDAGIIIVAATGNESSAEVKAPIIYPAAYPSVVAVGAVDDTETVAGFSNQGPEIDLVAPGVGILSTIPIGINFIGKVQGPQVNYSATPLEYSEAGKLTSQWVYCGLGHPDQFPPAVKGKIAVIKRGELTFAVKTRNALEAGAIGVVIFNNANTPIAWTLHSDQDPWSFGFDFPMAVALTKTDGEALLQKDGPITISSDPDDYGVYSGTSMATPHVAGAAALLWSIAPNATAAEIVNALIATAVDRGKRGVDPAYGTGVLDVHAAARLLSPYAFAGPPSTGRPVGKRGRG
jgi:serine protease